MLCTEDLEPLESTGFSDIPWKSSEMSNAVTFVELRVLEDGGAQRGRD